MNDLTIKIKHSGTTSIDVDTFKQLIKEICTESPSYDVLEALGIEDILTDDTDPAGIVYKIVVSSWEGEGGL